MGAAPATDPRTLEVTLRYQVPYPLAKLASMITSSHTPGDRLGFSLRLAEGAFRFLALACLADAARDAKPARIEKWHGMLRAPGMGKLLGLLRSTSEHVASRGAFVPEAAALCGTPWEEAAAAIVDLRNTITHDEIHVPSREAEPLYQQLVDPLRTVLAGVMFLRDYRLGVAQALRRAGARFEYYWYESRGLEELGQPVRLRGEAAPVTDAVLLLAAHRGEALPLAPYFHYGLARDDRAAHVFWLQQVEDGDDPAVYKHPVYRQEVRGGLVDPEDPDGGGLDLAGYVAQRGRWPVAMSLGLDETSHKALRPVEALPSFDQRYERIGKLGEGGMGEVWEARDTVLDRRCALKILRAELMRSHQALRRFLREGQLLGRIRHRGIAEVYDLAISSDHTPYLTMELIDGEDLGHYLERCGPMKIEQAVTLLEDVLDALQAVHEAGVIHRDIKPSNIMLTDGRARVLDFGIAAVGGGTHYTGTLDRMGTPAFMAPEQWRGESTPRCDVFAAGQLFYALVVGEAPTPGASLRTSGLGLPSAIVEVHERATAMSPTERYPSARALAEALRAGLELAKDAPRVTARPTDDPIDGLIYAEEALPLPIAIAVHDAGLARGAEPYAYAMELIAAFEAVVRYLLATRLAALPLDIPDDLARVVGRLTVQHSLGEKVRALTMLGAELGPGPVGTGALQALGSFVSVRNEMVHRGVDASTMGDTARALESALGVALHELRGLADEVLYVPLATSPGATRCWRAMGCAPNAWELEIRVAPDGPFVVTASRELALHPFVLPGPRPDRVAVFDTLTRDHTAVHVSPTHRIVSPDHESSLYDEILRVITPTRA